MNDEELQKILSHKPVLTDPHDKIKYVVFLALVQRGWKGVGSEYSGVLTKNDFVLTLYKADASQFPLKEPNEYLVPTAISYFQIPRATWVLEQYNKVYDSGKMQNLWDFLYDQPESMDDSDTFMKFINGVDSIASKSQLELQGMGSTYTKHNEEYLTFSPYNGPITDTGVFLSLVDLDPIKSKVAYQIQDAKEDEEGDRYFVLSQLEPKSFIETMVPCSVFGNLYESGQLVPLSVKKALSEDIFELVDAASTAMSGLPKPIQELNFSLDKQKFIGEALNSRLYVLPLLKVSEENCESVLKLLQVSSEYDMLNQIPDDSYELDALLEYARAGFSLYQPLQCDSEDEMMYDLHELLESFGSRKNDLLNEYGVSMVELLTYKYTFYLDGNLKGIKRPNFAYIELLLQNNILVHLCNALTENATMNSDGVLFLHKVYLDFDTKNEIRSFFFEVGYEDVFEHSFADSTYISFDWRTGFGLDCAKYSLVRVPSGYKVLNTDRKTSGFLLKVNGECFSYGDVSCVFG